MSPVAACFCEGAFGGLAFDSLLSECFNLPPLLGSLLVHTMPELGLSEVSSAVLSFSLDVSSGV